MKFNQKALIFLNVLLPLGTATGSLQGLRKRGESLNLAKQMSNVFSLKDDCEESPEDQGSTNSPPHSSGSPESSSNESPDSFGPGVLNANCPIFRDNPIKDTELSQKMIDATMPCGYYESQGCTYDVIYANIDHPGEYQFGSGSEHDLELNIPYIVQFDIGVHPNLKETVQGAHDDWDGGDGGDEKRPCIGCDSPGETCLELIVESDSDATGECAGLCGSGCGGTEYAKDCLKHDVCATYKALLQRDTFDPNTGDGFCFDVDCGDEAAQTVMNCYLEEDWGVDEEITCEKDNFNNPKAYGYWSDTTNFFGGPCDHFTDWNNGQGLPDWDKIYNPYEFLDHLARVEDIDVSAGYDPIEAAAMDMGIDYNDNGEVTAEISRID